MTSAALQTRLRDGIAAALLADRGRAQQLLRDVVAADPENEEAWLWLAAVASSTEEAVPCLRRVIDIAPYHPHARSALGRVLLGQGVARATTDAAGTRVLFSAAADLLPAGDDMKQLVCNRLVARGASLVKIGQRAEAREMFEEAAALAPDEARIWFALAQLATTPASALEPLRRCVQLDPNHQKARLGLAEVLTEMASSALADGERTQARSLLLEACALDSSNVDIWIALGRTHDTGEAMGRVVERIREISPEHPAVAVPPSFR